MRNKVSLNITDVGEGAYKGTFSTLFILPKVLVEVRDQREAEFRAYERIELMQKGEQPECIAAHCRYHDHHSDEACAIVSSFRGKSILLNSP